MIYLSMEDRIQKWQRKLIHWKRKCARIDHGYHMHLIGLVSHKVHFRLLGIKWAKYVHETTLSCVVNLNKSQYYLV